MQHKKFVACASAAVLALAMACSKHSTTPVSPTAALPGAGDAAADGSTLKVTAPTPQSPINGQQPDTLVLTAGKSSAEFTNTPSLNYEFEVYNSANARVYRGVEAGGSGGSVSHSVTSFIEFDQPHTWRVRAIYANAAGPWSSAASFRSPAGGYIRGNELFDPLTNGRTVGTAYGPTQFVAGQGIELMSHQSRVTYELGATLEAGEFSVMVTGFDEGSPGDKTKIISMQEGGGDITTNDYRFTVEKRGRSYPTPGATTFRMINGDAGDHGYINDGARFAVAYSDELWYFWKATWGPGFGRVEVREGSPNGRVIYGESVRNNGHAYRPVPHLIHLGAPVGRAGEQDASIPGTIYKNVWVSARPRPNFPTILTQPQ